MIIISKSEIQFVLLRIRKPVNMVLLRLQQCKSLSIATKFCQKLFVYILFTIKYYKKLNENMGVDLQLQIYILSGVFSLIFIIIIFFLAGICGQISKLKHEHLKTNCDHMRHTG